MKKRILVVDDHAVVRQGIQTLMGGQYQICGEAENGLEAIQKTKELQPDLVILDVNMPVMNGLDAAREIRRLCPLTQILILSLHDTEQLERDAKSAGADAALSKSKAPRELRRILEQLLGTESS